MEGKNFLKEKRRGDAVKARERRAIRRIDGLFGPKNLKEAQEAIDEKWAECVEVEKSLCEAERAWWAEEARREEDEGGFWDSVYGEDDLLLSLRAPTRRNQQKSWNLERTRAIAQEKLRELRKLEEELFEIEEERERLLRAEEMAELVKQRLDAGKLKKYSASVILSFLKRR